MGRTRERLGLPCLALLLVVGGSPARAGERGRAGGAPPAENSSYVPDDDETLRKTLAAVEKAFEAADAVGAVRALQRLVDGPASAVVAVGGAAGESGVFEGASRVAHHRVVSEGAATLAAYEAEFGGAANDLVAQGVARRDPARLRVAADRFLPSSAGRRAALLLADLALEAGDVDEALGWLERLEDLEEVSAKDLAAQTARWRKARLDRTAVALASGAEALPRVRAWLEAGESGPRPAEGDLRDAPQPPDWPTLGGDASRARVPRALREGLALSGSQALHDGGPEVFPREEPGKGHGARPSPWIPSRAVVSGDRAYASDGRSLRVFDLATGRPVMAPVSLLPGARTETGAGVRSRDARRLWGWIEGHGLTVAGDRVWAYVPAERRRPDDVEEVPPDVPEGSSRAPAAPPPRRPVNRDDHLVALRIDRRGATTLWEAGGDAATPGLPEGLRLFGTPLLYRGSLHVAGLRITQATKDRFEAYHVALDPETGSVRSVTFLGSGGPVRRRRDDELIPASCAASRGRVVVLTNLGVAAAVDAVTGRTAWSYRYDRGRPDGDDLGRRLEEGTEPGDRTSSFVNQPPLLAGDRAFLAPTDARVIIGLFDRPRGPDRLLRAWRANRTESFRNMAVEQLAGVTTGARGVPPTLVVVGQGFVSEPLVEPWTCVAALDPARGTWRWERALPFGGESETYGTALVTETEVFVPTFRGIAAYRLADGADLPALDRRAIPSGVEALLYEEERPFGNLVPVPGRGILAVNEGAIAFWLRSGR